MATEYGVSRTFGDWTISNQGFSSKEAAILDVYQRAFDRGVWRPRALREKWWQFWRPVEHDEIERKFTN